MANKNTGMSKWKYFISVGFPLWWEEVKSVLSIVIGALLFFLVAVPLGFLREIKEKNRRK
jgi:hypothetical protein